MSECVFCKIIVGNSPSTIVYRDEQTTVFQTVFHVHLHLIGG